MEKAEAQREVRQILAVLRIIVLSLAMGVVAFLVVALTRQPSEPPEQPKLWMYMAGLAGMALLTQMVVPRVLFMAIRRKIAQGTWQPQNKRGIRPPQTDEGLLMAALQSKTIVGCALLEGAGFANVFAFMSEGRLTSVVIAAFLIVMIAAHFPLRMRVDAWLERQRQWLEEERSLNPRIDQMSS